MTGASEVPVSTVPIYDQASCCVPKEEPLTGQTWRSDPNGGPVNEKSLSRHRAHTSQRTHRAPQNHRRTSPDDFPPPHPSTSFLSAPAPPPQTDIFLGGGETLQITNLPKPGPVLNVRPCTDRTSLHCSCGPALIVRPCIDRAALH